MEGEKSMFMNRFLTGTVIGGALGALGAIYVLSSNVQRKQVFRRGKRLIDMTNHKIKEMI